MTLALPFPALPPALDGIGDHTARLAEVLSPHAAVHVLTAQREPLPVPGATVTRAFDGPGRLDGLAEAVLAVRPDWVLVPYNPFSWGRRGWAPGLVAAVRAARQAGVRVAVLVHEPFTPLATPKEVVMSTWQRAQLWALGRMAEVVFTSIERWAERFTPWFPGARVVHLPIGSNIPVVASARAEARAALGVGEGLVLGLFGRASEPCLGAVRAAVEAVPGAELVYLGTAGAAVRDAVGAVRDLGPLPPADVSRAFAAFDVHLAPYPDGATTRRGTLMAGLAHGVPVVSTDGELTGTALRAAAPDALRLAPAGDPAAFAAAARALAADPGEVGARGRAHYRERFDWPVAARRVLGALGR